MSMITNLLVSITRPIRMPKYLRPDTSEAKRWMSEHSNSSNGLSYLGVSGLGLAAASIGLGLLGIKGDNETSKTIGGIGTAAGVACIGLDYIARHSDFLSKLNPTGSGTSDVSDMRDFQRNRSTRTHNFSRSAPITARTFHSNFVHPGNYGT